LESLVFKQVTIDHPKFDQTLIFVIHKLISVSFDLLIQFRNYRFDLFLHKIIKLTIPNMII